jgi:site-specific DNA recombinase
VSEEIFNTVQDTLAGKKAPVPKQRQNPDFPLRGFVRCYQCKKRLTAAAPHGRSKHYPRYWCWQKGCYAVSVSKETLETQFIRLLGMVQPTAEFIAQLPQISAANWELGKKRVADDRRALQTRLNEQNALNRRAIEAKLTGDLSPEDFSAFKSEVTSRITEIERHRPGSPGWLRGVDLNHRPLGYAI